MLLLRWFLLSENRLSGQSISESARWAMPAIYESKGQQTWLDYGLPDLRSLDRALRSCPIEEVAAGEDVAEAVEVVASNLGLIDAACSEVCITSPLGGVRIRRATLRHIVEKRQDARERYVRVALDTLTGPLEIWRVAYSDGSARLAFIGAYESRRQMLVVVNIQAGNVLWNFMQTDAKALNKHRHGELLYQRYHLF
ncbi:MULTISPECIES: PBECR2 nuclease fold domain-containing protein [unclassified Pseudomonas]|uniref:PBECR2 nuclease fold domain-containing protein n=1 Tax=unclassified Pseudomonas TaxID=196821 RepID=UPI002115412E|nr:MULTISPECIES: PBECR2 nuclease fold domain-containing protein [unclassified Pseudomonas]MCR4538661.1 PBECR2 nuclease fold domain-containing protein [Pseudomonas sp. 18.1.10]